MLSEDSDLTDLPSSEDDYEKSTKKMQTTKATGYRLRNVLKPGRTTQYTAKALYDQMHAGDIDLEPEYQRDIVWSDIKQIGLIDSIFRNFYVPPIIFAVTTEDDGTEKRVCIDGKQRLTSIQKFIGGLIPHRDPFTNERLWFTDSKNGPKRKLLPPQYRNLFQNKQVVCIEYSDLPPEFEREVFQRVQMGMALTTAEKLQAISGPWPDLVREVTKEFYISKDGLAGNMNLDEARARAFQNISQSLFCIDQLPDQVHGTTMQLEKWLSKEDGPSEATKDKIYDVFRIYRDLAKDKQLNAPFKKPARVAPAEFVMVGVLIAMHKGTHSLPQLSQAIGILRAETRAVHTDVRTNTKVFKTMFNVITKKVKHSALKETPGKPLAGKGSSIKAGKRKRDDNSNVDSSDEDNGDGNAEYRPKSKTRVPPSQPASRPTPRTIDPPDRVPSASSHVKVEETGSQAMLPPTPVQSTSTAIRPPPTGPSRLARIQAAKAQAADILNKNTVEPRPSTPTSIPGSNSLLSQQYPPLPPHSGHQPLSNIHPSLEAAMMGTSAPSPYHHPASYPASPLHAPMPTHSVTQHNSQMPIHIPNLNGSNDYQLTQTSNVRAGHPTNNGYRPHGSPRLSRDGDGGIYRNSRGGFSERRDRDASDRDYRDRSKEGRDKDRTRDHDQENPRSRGTYSGRGDANYKSRDHTWDRKLDKDGRDFRRGPGY